MAYDKHNKLHIVVATAVIRNDEGKFLVLKRAEHETAFPGMWSFPGGKLEDSQTTEEALVTEIREEVGLVMKSGKLLLKEATFIRPDEQTVKVFSYLVEVENTNKIKLSDDFTEYKWVTLEELRRLPNTGIEDEVAKAQSIIESGADISLFKIASVRNDPS